jgi:hypothetical protein
MAEVLIPDKMFFRIGEVSEITGVKPYVLRYWESEFRLLRPNKNKSGQRVYRRRDVETALEIKDLLHLRKFTIAGAKNGSTARAGSRLPSVRWNSASTPPTGKPRSGKSVTLWHLWKRC